MAAFVSLAAIQRLPFPLTNFVASVMICIYTAMVAEYAGTTNRAGNAMGVSDRDQQHLETFTKSDLLSTGPLSLLIRYILRFDARCQQLRLLLRDLSHRSQSARVGNGNFCLVCVVSVEADGLLLGH